MKTHLQHLLVRAAAVSVCVLSLASAHADTLVDFSTTGTSPSDFTTPISGTLDFATTGNGVTPTSITVTAANSGLGFSLPYTFTSTDSFYTGTFDVTAGGLVTAADFYGFDTGNNFHIYFNFSGENGVLSFETETEDENQLGFAGTTYTAVSATPEPEALWLLSPCLALPAGLRRLRRGRRPIFGRAA
jgi:hypothetical protein